MDATMCIGVGDEEDYSGVEEDDDICGPLTAPEHAEYQRAAHSIHDPLYTAEDDDDPSGERGIQ